MYFTTRGIICNNCKWNVGVPSLSCVQPFATLWTVAHQASLSMEFSRQDYCSRLPFPSTRDLPDSVWIWVSWFSNRILYHWATCCCCCSIDKLCLTLCDPIDCSPPGSPIHGILQARILEWVAMPSSRGSSQPRVKPASQICSTSQFLTIEIWILLSYQYLSI